MKLKVYPESVEEYLEKKALSKWSLEWIEVPGIESVIVIPAICEFKNIKALLSSLTENNRFYLQKSLVIFVINNSVSSNQYVKEDNKKSIDLLKAIINKKDDDDFIHKVLSSGIQIGLLDAASEGKEFEDEESGVGLTRKIGMDMALQIFDYSKPGKKIIISLDADCTVEANYISEICLYFNKYNISAATIDFKHDISEEGINKLGIISYEIFLRHYVSGLLFAESPYSFHTIGSIFACDHEAYIKAGGMNKRQAAEDFYFLQKLAKLYKIHKINTTKVKPSARESWRVPFGTGRSMTNFQSNGKEIQLYDPEEYLILKDWSKLFNSDLALKTNIILKEAKKIHNELYNFLVSKGFTKDWDKILDNCKSEKQLNYQRKNWFDAFKTLKLIHHLRDTSFPMLDVKSGVEKLFKIFDHKPEHNFQNNIDSIEDLYEIYLSEIRILEESISKNLSIQIS
jgi:hypothetical protein